MNRSLKATLIVISMIASLRLSAFAQTVQIIVSSNEGDRLAAKSAVEFRETGKAAAKPQAGFTIDPGVRHQTITGFGASFLEAGLICINSLEPAAQEEVLGALFDPERGAGFSAMKTVIAGTDFMSAGPWYSYNDTPGDVAMKNFSIERDLGPNGLVTYIKRARKHGNFVLQAPMDYPPDWMITNLADRKKQDVDPKYYDALALYYLRYLQEYEKQGIHIDYLCLFNEPGIYTKIPYESIRVLLKDHVGPLLEKNGVKTRIQLSEGFSRENAAKNYPTVLDDPEARKYVANLPYHGYDLKRFDLIRQLHERYPDLPIWMTEICHAYQAGTPKSMKLPNYDFKDGDFWAKQIYGDLEAGASVWLYWNMILDEKGGPWAVSPIHGNPDPNIQHPVVIIDREKKQAFYPGVYYYLAHFSKYVRPGSVRIETAGSQPDVRCIAFQRPDGRIVANLVNSGEQPAETRLAFRGRELALKLPAISITTCLWADQEKTK
jgi:glucosylceramidase